MGEIIYTHTNKNFPKDYIGKTITPLRLQINNLRTTVLHSNNSNLPVSTHDSDHEVSTLEDCNNLKRIYDQEEHPDPELTLKLLRYVEIARAYFKINNKHLSLIV